MNRRHFLSKALVASAAAAVTPLGRTSSAANEPTTADGKGVIVSTSKLTPTRSGAIKVAVAVSEGATVIDFAGPWDVFGSVMIPERGDDAMPFELFMVSEKTEPLVVENGMKIIPHFTFGDAPASQVVVVPAQRGSDALHKWLRKTVVTADVIMSVCTGVFQLGRAGLLNQNAATTHHDHYDHFVKEFPNVDLRRGVRFVENSKISTSGGELCGIDLSLRVVERYFGRAAAKRTAVFIEYQGNGWIV